MKINVMRTTGQLGRKVIQAFLDQGAAFKTSSPAFRVREGWRGANCREALRVSDRCFLG